MTKRLFFGLLALLPGLALAQRPAKPKPKPAAPPKAASGPYFQQEVNYSIDVKLDDRTHQLRGHEELTYLNNSPQALTFIWFHLWPNAYRDNNTAFGQEQKRQGSRKFLFAKPDERGFIDSLAFQVNGQPAKLEFDPENPDIAKLVLPQALAPGATATIATPFRVKVPGSFSRMGHVGQSYQISQWYPKPAVLDRRGWHPIPYLSQGEFYSEYGSFDVSITLPSNYTVGATGVLQNPDEQARMAGLAAATAAKKTADDFGKDMAFPASAPTTKTLRYKQDRVHDFAWFADKRFNVLRESVTMPSGRVVTSWVLFTNRQAERWIKGLQEVNDALINYSKWVGEYPYASATAVDGALTAGSGMEYPMVTVTEPDAIVHEVGHNWFYGILGSNERDFPWMDEGVNTYEQIRVEELSNPQAGMLAVLQKIKPVANTFGLENLPGTALSQLPYQALATRGLAQPVQGPTSADYTQVNYAATVYEKTGVSLKYLAGYLGQEKFDAAMHLYYTRWQFKHPYPEDMQAVFEESTGQKLGWFFRDFLTTAQPYEADLAAVAVFNDVVKVLVRTESERPWSVPVSTVDAQNNILETLWTTPFGNTDPNADEEVTSQLNFKRDNVVAVVVDAGYLAPQLNRRNDRLRLENGPRDRSEPLRLRPLFSVERWDKATVNWLPVVGANTSDKFMLGAAFHNSLIAPKKLQYLAMPMYSFNRNELNGIGRLQLNSRPERGARQFITALTVQRFERYFKTEPSFTFVLPHRIGYLPQHQLQVAFTSVTDQDRNRTSSITTAEYSVRHDNAINSWSANVELNHLLANSTESNDRGAVLLRASAALQHFYAKDKRVQLRLFGGRFLQSSTNTGFVMGLSGSPDYRRQTPFLDRQQISHTVTAQLHQTDNRDGAFKAFLPVASQRWLSALNAQIDVPGLPLAVFGDLGATSETQFLAGRSTSQRLFYDAGFTLPIARSIFEIYVPVAGSQFNNGLPGSRQEFTDGIRFVLALNKLSPFRLLDENLTR
ncbi:M1 family metallopeptidase [Hymenobacter properus]|uniref:M1 family metallopeptidase n=1 Tax=Hymenobacter properus TaxID=2791026 RepID=A0A931BH86_9BACT|nr:M1 family metallopeptidase [Hymenobacter properus]MBF9143904.1 M1 family metallopeptidase [Hymenobacter properus]MBR7722718.1 M1 family metallopeptidase [Microvirga sp. SRT04]